jgi:hypothetical protein
MFYSFPQTVGQVEPSQDARARATAEDNTRPEDLIPIYRKHTHIDPSGEETDTCTLFRCRQHRGTGKIRCRCVGSRRVRYGNRSSLAIPAVQVE